MQSRNPKNIKLIDVSHHQKNIDWNKVKADGIQGVMIKATEGVGYVDDMFHSHVQGALTAGLEVGFYHYARPETHNTAQAEADSFMNAVKDYAPKLPHVLDLEGASNAIGNDEMTKWAVEWLGIVQKETYHSVMLYTGGHYAKAYCGKALAIYPLWVAHYGVDKPMDNGKWDRWAMFQYTSSGKVNGVPGNVDMNEMEPDTWNRYTKPKLPEVQGMGTYSVDGSEPIKTIIVGGRMYAPVRDVVESLGGRVVQYDNERKHADITKGE